MYIISANSHLNESGKITKLILCRNIEGYPIWIDMSLSYGYIILTEEYPNDTTKFTKMVLPSNTSKSITNILNETIKQIIESGYDIESLITKEIDISYSSPIIGYLITYTKEYNNDDKN